MNYLGRIGMLGLTGRRGRPAGPGRRPDRRPRRRRADGRVRDPRRAARARASRAKGQLVDVSMADGALSWLAMVAGQYLCDGVVPQRGSQLLAGGIICYRPYVCADGEVTLGALEPKFWRNWCEGVGREDLIERQFDVPGSDAHKRGRGDLRRPHARRVGGVRRRARLLPGARAGARRGARRRARQGARDGRRARPAGRGADGPPARSPGQAIAHPGRREPPARVRVSASTPTRYCAAAGYGDEEIAALKEAGAVGGPAVGATGSFLS